MHVTLLYHSLLAREFQASLKAMPVECCQVQAADSVCNQARSADNARKKNAL